MKIFLQENLKHENFVTLKFPDLRYAVVSSFKDVAHECEQYADVNVVPMCIT